MSHPKNNQRAASAGDFSLLRLIEFGSLESPPSNWLRATRKPDVLVSSEIRGVNDWLWLGKVLAHPTWGKLLREFDVLKKF